MHFMRTHILHWKKLITFDFAFPRTRIKIIIKRKMRKKKEIERRFNMEVYSVWVIDFPHTFVWLGHK